MPELPEVQALAERLHDSLSGAELKGVVALQFSGAKTFDPPVESLFGRVLKGVYRRGKYLIFDFAGPRVLVHLSQGGRIVVEQPPKRTRTKGGVVRFYFRERPSILIKEYGTQRKAGWWVLAEGDDGPLERLGPDPFSEQFARVIEEAGDSRRVHTVLRDQRTVAGIGRGYSDDILHRAQLSPYATLAKLTTDERAALLDAVHEVLNEALARERTRTGGLPPKLRDNFTVHGRHEQPCPRCKASLKRVWYEDYEITYCPACQTDDRVLADRRMSRLLR